MPIAESRPIRFTPRGLTDAFDSTDMFQGACRNLQNLVFDQSNPELVIARPGVGGALTAFAGFATPGFVSVQVTIGNRVYGMVATSLTAGVDQPFCFDLNTSSFVAVTGCTAGNAEGRPASPATSGAWTPPTMAVVGDYVIITHPGYSGSGGHFYGLIKVSTMAYTSVNLATHALPAVPTGVANFSNRAYFSYANSVYYSDVLDPTTATNAGQSLTFGDTSAVLGMSGLPVTTTSGGIVGALLVFKGTQIWQVTGDAAVSGTLSINYLSLNVGCVAPRTIVPSPFGTIFVGPDCVYTVTPMTAVTALTFPGQNMPDLRQPFAYMTTPTRAAASFAGNVYRICMATIVDGLAATNDYWFDTRKMRWNGPHTFTYDCASGTDSHFILTSASATGKLFISTVVPTSGSVYTDNNVGYNIDLVSSDLPKHDEMAMKQVVESTIELSSAGGPTTYGITAFNDAGSFLASTSVTTAQSGPVWGSNHWGDGSLWSSSVSQPKTFPIKWPFPLVFNKIALEVTCPASVNIGIGTCYLRAQKTGYTLQQA